MSRVLVVADDNAGTRALAERLLAAGYDVDRASNALLALARLEREPFIDIVVSDVAIAGMSGYRLCEHIHERHDTLAPPVVLLTSSSESEPVVKGLRSGAAGFVAKPFAPEELLATLEDLLEPSHSEPPEDDLQAPGVISFRFLGEQVQAPRDPRKLVKYFTGALHALVRSQRLADERDAAEQAATHAHLFLRATLDALTAGIVILDEDARLVEANRAWRKRARDAAAYEVGRSYADCFARQFGGPLPAWLVEGLAAVAQRPERRLDREHHVESAAQSLWLAIRVSRFSDDGATRIVVAHEDVSARHAIEGALRVALERERMVLNHLPVLVFRQTFADGRSDFHMSENVGRVLGQPAERFGEPGFLMSLLHPDDLAAVSGVILAEDSWTQHVRVRHGDGEYRWYLTHGIVRRDDHDDLSELLGVGVDISDQKELEARLARSHKLEALGSLAGGVAHDFNNVLTVVASYATFALEDAKTAGLSTDDLDEVLSAAKGGGRLTAQLLAFSKTSSLRPEPVDAVAAIKALSHMLRRSLGTHIVLRVHAECDRAAVFMDPGQLDQVLINLAVNARDAMHGGGTLTITTRIVELDEHDASPLAPGRYASIELTDSGCGMDEATRRRLFEPFFTTKAQGQGPGLGLASCYGIVAAAGGDIRVASDVGKGSCFTVYLPELDAERSSSRPLPAPLSRSRQHPGGLVLVAEDEDAVRRMMKRALEGVGYRVHVARDGAEALRLFEAHRRDVDFLLTDIMLPELSGYELAERVLEVRPNLPVLLTSGYSGEALVAPTPIVKSLPVLWKPYAADRLLQEVLRTLSP